MKSDCPYRRHFKCYFARDGICTRGHKNFISCKASGYGYSPKPSGRRPASHKLGTTGD